MEKKSFQKDWICYRTGNRDEAFAVTIPHDAMLLDEKKENCPAGVNTGWYDAQDYTYEKVFFVPESYSDKKTILEFEGIYHKASVYINDVKVGYQEYGYLGLFIDLETVIKYGEDNTIRVEVVNSDQPNSRWYSGTGIYRPVWLYLLPKQHIAMEGVRITTLDYRNPRISIEVKVENSQLTAESNSAKEMDTVGIEILDGTDVIASMTAKQMEMAKMEYICEVDLPNAKLWSTEQPYLYTCRVTYGEDVREERFGIRVVECDEQRGFCINGERVILRGACIHHDNGLLGACAYDFAERRKVQILKDGGYNAIRSAHNPCSKAMLTACDELGMLMMDEYVDVWYIHKTKYDYANRVEENYKEDLKKIVDKDYNHPSVVMYSTGNEVAETGQKKGIALCGKLTERLHELDSTRPVTCGINIFFNFLSSMGFGVYSDKKAEQAAEDAKKKKAVGSEFFNVLAGFMGADFMKFGATLYPCDVKTRDAFANMDVAGYNYGIFRYQHDLKKYPKRLILGSETFCSDAYRFWEEAKKNTRLIGDFVWAGMDYLGEVGIGAWEYEDYAPRRDQGKGWVSAGSGRIDLTGKQLCEMKYTRVAFELDKIGMGVVPVNSTGKKHSPSAWKMSNAIESWSWSGCEGQKAIVEVYARADKVALFVNGTRVGTKSPKGDCKVVFHTSYQNGELKAVAYDKDEKVIAEKVLKTAGAETKLTLEPELACVNREQDLCYVRLKYTDEEGTVKPLVRGDIKVEVTGGTLLGLGSACPFYEKSYLSDVADTYYGEALAIIKPEEGKEIVVKADSPYGSAKTSITVRD